MPSRRVNLKKKDIDLDANGLPKLVRDYIPELMKGDGQTPVVKKVTNDTDFFRALSRKLVEEVREYDEEYSLEELADVIEVIEEMQYLLEKVLPGRLDKVRGEKRLHKGAFTARLMLIST